MRSTGGLRDTRALLSHPDLDARAAGQVARAPAQPRVSWIGDGNPVDARLGEANPCSEATLVDPDDLPADRRARLGDPEKSGRDYRRATDHPPVHPHDLSRLSKSWCHDRDAGRGPCRRRRRRSGRRRAQEKKDASDRDGDAEPHEATLNHLASSVKRSPSSSPSTTPSTMPRRTPPVRGIHEKVWVSNRLALSKTGCVRVSVLRRAGATLPKDDTATARCGFAAGSCGVAVDVMWRGAVPPGNDPHPEQGTRP